MNINYDYYRIFYYVAKYQSFTRAAEVLLANQPNVTRTIRILENELGCTLFHRSNRGVRLTQEGEQLYEHVRVAFESLQQAEEELTHGRTLESGTVVISASEMALHELLLPVLKEYHHRYPGIKIHIINHSTPQAVASLKDGIADLAVVTTPTGDLGRNTRKRTLLSFREVAVCGPAFRDALVGAPVTLRQLLEYPIICLGRGTKTYEFYQELFRAHGMTLSPDIELATVDQVMPTVSNDMGVGFLPRNMAEGALRQGEIFEVELREEIPSREICLLERTDRKLNLAAAELLKMMTAPERK